VYVNQQLYVDITVRLACRIKCAWHVCGVLSYFDDVLMLMMITQ